MNAITTTSFEELLGIQMAEFARKEGHRPGVPNMDKRIVEKCRAERLANNRLRAVGERNQKLTLAAMKKGCLTVKQIVKETGLGEESVRKACRRLHEAGLVQRNGAISISGGQAYVYKVTVTGR
jgi:transcription initiation factor IIE alpha subunit